MDLKKQMWFDTMEQKILTYQDLMKEYVLYVLDLAKEDEEDINWIRCHPEEYTFDVWLEHMSSSSGGVLVDITNSDEFMRRKIA